jgi:membrane-bound metal-dependent hydrolase YbcI (DUF457 family)
MADGKMHFTTGAVIGLLTYIANKNQRNEQISIPELAVVGACSGFAGVLPDIIDPPTNPQHRQIGHSAIISAATLPKIWQWTQNNPNLTQEQKDLIRAMIFAFGSHLVLDSGTPAGLPF